MKTVVIVGGGMSGMIAAICAAKKKNKVILLERQEALGKKIFLTGNGKCNLSNVHMTKAHYLCQNSSLLEKTLAAFPISKEIAFWEELGLLTTQIRDGIYPYSKKADSVVHTLIRNIEKNQVEIRCGFFVNEIKKTDKEYQVISEKGSVKGDVVILACGGMAGCYKEETFHGNKLALSLGHKVHFCYPALVQTKCENLNFDIWKGVRCDAKISLYIDNQKIKEEAGELQITEQGLSGIPVFQLTRYIGEPLRQKREVYFEIDFFSQYTEEDFISLVKTRYERNQDEHLKTFLYGMQNEKIHEYFLKKLCYDENKIIGKDYSFPDILRLAKEMKHYKAKVKGLNSFKNAQISTGGVDTMEISEEFESKLHAGLYITGEMLDVTGACGGYNLHFAVASGYIAGNCCTEDR